jgi:hypothetical protein
LERELLKRVLQRQANLSYSTKLSEIRYPVISTPQLNREGASAASP